MSKNKISLEEIDKKISEIKSKEFFLAVENKKISELKKGYYYEMVDKRFSLMAKNLAFNLDYLVKKHNIVKGMLHARVYDKTGIFDYAFSDYQLYNPEHYNTHNILKFAMAFGFTFNISFLDLLLYRLDYLEKKNFVGTF